MNVTESQQEKTEKSWKEKRVWKTKKTWNIFLSFCVQLTDGGASPLVLLGGAAFAPLSFCVVHPSFSSIGWGCFFPSLFWWGGASWPPPSGGGAFSPAPFGRVPFFLGISTLKGGGSSLTHKRWGKAAPPKGSWRDHHSTEQFNFMSFRPHEREHRSTQKEEEEAKLHHPTSSRTQRRGRKASSPNRGKAWSDKSSQEWRCVCDETRQKNTWWTFMHVSLAQPAHLLLFFFVRTNGR